MNPKFKPMLAVAAERQDVKFPVLASVKLDGIRCTIFDGVAYSRSLKPLPNKEIQAWAKENKDILEAFDGEIICGEPNAEDVFNRTTSFVMSENKIGEDWKFYAFDYVHEKMSAQERFLHVESDYYEYHKPCVKIMLVHQTLIIEEEQLIAFEEKALKEGYEGTMLKDPKGLYKFGRSTLKSQQLLKRKTFVDDEFEIIGYEPLWHNTNEAQTNELGQTERSTKKEGLVAMEKLGALTCITKEGTIFNCGTGFDEAMRIALWEDRQNLIGKLAKVKYFPVGIKEAPRFPVFLGIRSPLDIS